MANYLVCDGLIDPAALTCSTGWQTSQAVDFQDLVALLQFDPQVFGIIFGACVVTFLVGHYAGVVTRNLSRN